ncbi:ExbD/TolR family protein [Stagnihabitans tardus]|uniref:Biopolymer transporter ExbD n=1 Tax=Stagnihabitans tardus TaxID=2699202 RepID=A0AAE4YA16_9RHOB|nr:biopolymer transporter ExbD [Stagnihabitans tardus]NBZ88813.1 biopolymer transporter ExbD [Stagnihabitans tardus]
MAIALRRPPPRRLGVSVVSMIDVMMILLFFFMITSSYLNLDMVPALEKSEARLEGAAPGAGLAPLLIRVSADSSLSVQGQKLSPADCEAMVARRLAEAPLTEVLIFPSGAAPLQGLVLAMDAVTRAGATRVKVIRIEAQP